MKAFISWSGERSHALGQALYDWLPMVLQSIEPWLSQSDIDAGERWANQVGKELEACNFGIICITRENISSPWILFEAGALAKSMQEGRVVPLLLDIEFKDIAGPLAQFQAKKVEKSGIFDVVTSINKFSDGKLSDTHLNRQFEALWPTFEKSVEQFPKNPPHAQKTRPQHEILEELVSSIRGLDMRFRESQEETPRVRRRRTRFHPVVLRDLLHSSDFGPSDPIQFLLLASFIKEEFPWMHELGVEAYREATHTSNKDTARRRFFAAIKMLHNMPFVENYSEKETYIFMREFERFISDLNFDGLLAPISKK
ncbi:toll/interleukin-1 receptor domain-containing protein [Nitrospirillum pindoramense]|uniref:TIR domain-containing protein n=1 Tax=Nitrospirillum amazonense TaxID=28077 RepID=A0A560HGV8_9PROT|nr:toll/interleukin-1 receptor domain-containing protein [Nitrospirillum amazonense]TWB45702.1 TIR domain-containing protein [Nitrospirillum amazonense]